MSLYFIFCVIIIFIINDNDEDDYIVVTNIIISLFTIEIVAKCVSRDC